MRCGFLWTLRDVMRCREGACLTAGIPCSSFIFMSLGSSGRTHDCPMGLESSEFVRLANNIVSRVSLLLIVALVRSVCFCVEQPNSTRLFAVPYMAYVRELAESLGLPFFERFLLGPYIGTVAPEASCHVNDLSWMGIFGHYSSKPSKAWGTSPGTYT